MTSTWMPRQRWDALVRGDGCPLCAEIGSGEAENTHGFVVADLQISQLRLSREQHVPGWCVLTCRRHVREPHELAPEERGDFFTDLLRAGQALEQAYAADKINLTVDPLQHRRWPATDAEHRIERVRARGHRIDARVRHAANSATHAQNPWL